MSAQAIRWARQQRTGGPTQKVVLLVLAAQSDRTGMCALPMRDIAREDSDADTGTVYRALGRLRSRGLIDWTTGAGRAANTYRLPIRASPRSDHRTVP